MSSTDCSSEAVSRRSRDEYDAIYAFPSEGDIFFDEQEDRQKAISFNGTVPTAMEVMRGGFQDTLSIGNPDRADAFVPTFRVDTKKKVIPIKKQANKAASVFRVEGESVSTEQCVDDEDDFVLSPIPLILLPNNFRVRKGVRAVVDEIKRVFQLDFTTDICYELQILEPHGISFEGVYVKGSRYTDFSIQLYDGGADCIIVEGQRMDKDSCCQTFRTIFDTVKRALCNLSSPTSTIDICDPIYGLYDPSSFELSGAAPPTDEEISESLRVMHDMLSNKNSGTQLEGARMLCDLAEDPAYTKRMADCGCVSSMVNLLKDRELPSLLRQQIVLVLAQLSCCTECAGTMVESGLIPILMTPVYSIGDFRTLGFRREAARILANVVTMHGTDAAKSVSREELQDWIVRISDMHDQDIRFSCQRAKESLFTGKGF